eukprot:1371742-Pyramimonas_sp.AAC.1
MVVAEIFERRKVQYTRQKRRHYGPGPPGQHHVRDQHQPMLHGRHVPGQDRGAVNQEVAGLPGGDVQTGPQRGDRASGRQQEQ